MFHCIDIDIYFFGLAFAKKFSFPVCHRLRQLMMICSKSPKSLVISQMTGKKIGCCGQNSIIRGWCYHIKNRWFDTMDRRTCFHSKRLTYSCFWFWQCIFSVDKSLSFFFFFSIIDSVCVSFLVVKKKSCYFSIFEQHQYGMNESCEFMINRPEKNRSGKRWSKRPAGALYTLRVRTELVSWKNVALWSRKL